VQGTASNVPGVASLTEPNLASKPSFEPEVNALPTAEWIAIDRVPGLSRLFLDHSAAAAAVRPFYPSMAEAGEGLTRPLLPAHWPELVDLLAEQNRLPSAAPALESLRQGAGVAVTGQQVGLFGGPLYTPLKAATALARARQATVQGRPHAAIFWLATEDHDFAEIDHVVFPARRALRKLRYAKAPTTPVPVGNVLLDETIAPLIEEAGELLGYSDAMTALEEAYRPGHSFAQAFAEFYSRAFAAQGLLVLDAGSRAIHRLGAPVLAAALQRAYELHAALIERNAQLQAAGYHAQVAVGANSSLLFLIDEKTGARQALKRTAATATEPQGLWQAGRQSYSTDELLGILASAPERISPSALLRPVFQDYLLGTSVIVGGPAEIAYFAQSAVLFERILGRVTPSLARFSATLIEPAMGELLRQHELTLERIWSLDEPSLAKLLAARAMPVEGKQLLSSAGSALQAELDPLLAWMRAVDAGLGQSGERAASKMRYQMNRLRNLAANFELQKEAALGRHAAALAQSLAPGGVLQERVHGAAYYFARYGFELAEELTVQAGVSTAGHSAIWL
jgi:bacillithiol biosynthesis cysteine-adding enzyme BshC